VKTPGRLGIAALVAAECLLVGCRAKPPRNSASGVRESMARRMCDGIAADLIRGRSDQFYWQMAPEYRSLVTPAQHKTAMAKYLAAAGRIEARGWSTVKRA
jgi:hypothetical protein